MSRLTQMNGQATGEGQNIPIEKLLVLTVGTLHITLELYVWLLSREKLWKDEKVGKRVLFVEEKYGKGELREISSVVRKRANWMIPSDDMEEMTFYLCAFSPLVMAKHQRSYSWGNKCSTNRLTSVPQTVMIIKNGGHLKWWKQI